MDKDENILIQAGLSEEQALIYDTLIEKGHMKASFISKWTGIKRGLTYKVLEQLEIMGLVEKKGGDGTVATFYPQHPSLLMHTLEGREKELALAKEMLKFSLGSLASKYNLITGKPSVQFFEGKTAIEKVTGDYPADGEGIIQVIDIELANKTLTQEVKKYLDERIKRKINKKMIVPNSTVNLEYISKKEDYTEYKYNNHLKELGISVQAYENKVSILDIKKENVIGLIIEDRVIADSIKSVLNALWLSSTSPD